MPTLLNRRSERLGITHQALARMSGVPIDTVESILTDPNRVPFESVAAVGRVLGVNYVTATKIPVKRLLRKRAVEKARYVARAVQASQGLEAAGVDPPGYKRLVRVAAKALLAGNKRKLWDDD